MASMKIGPKVRKLRGDWTQDELLEQMRKHTPGGRVPARETISRIENGQENVDTWIIVALAKTFGVTPNELLREDDAAPSPIKLSLLELGDEMESLPEDLAQYQLRMWRATLNETVRMLRAEATTVAPGEAWLLRALQTLPESRYQAFQQWLEGQERQVARTSAATG